MKLNYLFFWIFIFLTSLSLPFRVLAITVEISAIVPGCGDSIVSSVEQCDGPNFAGASCTSQGFSGGSLSCTSACTLNTSQCTTSSGTSGRVPSSTSIPNTNVVFTGAAYPGSLVTLLKDARVVATTVTNADATFQVTISGVEGGKHIFSFYSQDDKNIQSPIVSFLADIRAGVTTKISGIFITPGSDIEASELRNLGNLPVNSTGNTNNNSYSIQVLNPESPLFDVISEPVKTRIDSGSSGLSARTAPGEFLPISVKLSNFGGGKRIDVLIKYSILTSTGEEIYSSSETVAVETTANFVKTIQVPFGTAPGVYTAKTSIIYGGQLVPATTEFPFTVERKILGVFQSDFILYAGIIIIISILMVLLGRALITRRRGVRFAPLDYSNIPHDTRIFYEILSDTIMEMRERVGDDALKIASDIPGLKIDTETGRVLALTEHPSKIIATLVSEYEKMLGKKVSFSFRRSQNIL